MSSPRIKGNALLFKIGDASGTDYWADCSSVVLENEDDSSGVTTFEDAARSGTKRKWHFTLSGIQSTSSASFWRYLWDNGGEEVPFTYAPHGNETPTADKPHFIGNVKIKEKPSIGGEANEDGEYTFDYQLEVTAGPTLDDGSTVAAWAATTAYAANDLVTVTGGTLKCTTAGTSGSSEPAAPASVGGTVTDGTVTWTRTA